MYKVTYEVLESSAQIHELGVAHANQYIKYIAYMDCGFDDIKQTMKTKLPSARIFRIVSAEQVEGSIMQ